MEAAKELYPDVRVCQRCHGKGEIWVLDSETPQDATGRNPKAKIPCRFCLGTGKIDRIRHLELLAMEYLRLRDSVAAIADYAQTSSLSMGKHPSAQCLSLIEHALVSNLSVCDPEKPESPRLLHTEDRIPC